MLKILIPILTFISVFVSHILFFKIINFGCFTENADWFTAYLRLKEYYLGFSYAISVAFAVFAFMKFKACRGRSIGAGVGAGVWVATLWTLGCFLVGCCGSPMWIIYFNLFGISVLKIPKWSIAMMSLVMVFVGYLWLRKKLPEYCTGERKKHEK